jgi:hypothetical protein
LAFPIIFSLGMFRSISIKNYVEQFVRENPGKSKRTFEERLRNALAMRWPGPNALAAIIYGSWVPPKPGYSVLPVSREKPCLTKVTRSMNTSIT